MGKTGKIVLSVVLLAAAGVIYYVRAGNVNDLTARREYSAVLECLDCKKPFPAELDVAAVGPFECPHCKNKRAWFVWECGNPECKAHFVPEPAGDPPRQPAIPKCSKCGGSMVGRLSAED